MKKKIACPECERGWCQVVNLATNYMSALCETGALRPLPGGGNCMVHSRGGREHFYRQQRIFSMTQQLIIDALRNRIESGPVRCYYGDWIVVYRGREIARWDHHLNVLVVRRCTRPDRIYQCYMNGFFKAFRVPVRVRYHSGFHLQTKAGSVADLQTERVIKL